MLKVKWNRTDLENTPHPEYLGVTLDRTLSNKQHIHNTKIQKDVSDCLISYTDDYQYISQYLHYLWQSEGDTVVNNKLI